MLRSPILPEGGPVGEDDIYLIDVRSGELSQVDLSPELRPGLARAPLLWVGSLNELAFYYLDPSSGQADSYLVI